MSNEQCPPHHWVIDEFNVGRCVKCGAVKNFGALLKKQKGVQIVLSDHAERRGRPRKER